MTKQIDVEEVLNGMREFVERRFQEYLYCKRMIEKEIKIFLDLRTRGIDKIPIEEYYKIRDGKMSVNEYCKKEEK